MLGLCYVVYCRFVYIDLCLMQLNMVSLFVACLLFVRVFVVVVGCSFVEVCCCFV